MMSLVSFIPFEWDQLKFGLVIPMRIIPLKMIPSIHMNGSNEFYDQFQDFLPQAHGTELRESASESLRELRHSQLRRAFNSFLSYIDF
jgi:hypothetical protein